jgi:hypothetical protein
VLSRRNTNSRLAASRVVRTSAISDRSISAITLRTTATLASGAPVVRLGLFNVRTVTNKVLSHCYLLLQVEPPVSWVLSQLRVYSSQQSHFFLLVDNVM